MFSQLESRSKAKHDSLLSDIERRNKELASAEFRKKALAIAGTAAASAVTVTVAVALKRKY